MKFVADLPWELVTDEGTADEQKLDAQLYIVDESGYKCEYGADGMNPYGPCHSAPFGIGCSDMHAPKFCLKHYFDINDSKTATDGEYKIIPLTQ